jgi:hypothetical protein
LPVVNKTDGSDYDLYIGRPSILGNPFRISEGVDRDKVIRLFRYYAIARMDMDKAFRQAVLQCRGRTLACWCKPLPCHGDVILELAEGIQ